MSAREYIDMEMMRSSGVKSRYDELFGTPERGADVGRLLLQNGQL